MDVHQVMAYWVNEFPDNFKTQEICNELVFIYPYLLEHISDHLKTQEM